MIVICSSFMLERLLYKFTAVKAIVTASTAFTVAGNALQRPACRIIYIITLERVVIVGLKLKLDYHSTRLQESKGQDGPGTLSLGSRERGSHRGTVHYH